MPFISQEVEDVPDRKLSPRHTCTPGDISKGGSSFFVSASAAMALYVRVRFFETSISCIFIYITKQCRDIYYKSSPSVSA